MLNVNQKRMIKEVVKYYISIGNTYESMIDRMIRYSNNELASDNYNDWLMGKIMELFNSNGVSVSDCLENKAILMSAVSASKNKDKGELETPIIWVKEAQKMMEECIKDWRKMHIWDCCCGNGNLEKGIEAESIYLSTINKIDADVVRTLNPNAKVFELDFTKDIDLDDVNSMFTDKLPEELQEVIKEDRGIVFLINPPHKSATGSKSDVASFMKSKGYGICANDSLYQFMYRILSLKNIWGIDNIYVGMFGNTSMFIEENCEDIMSDWMDDFKYIGGMCISKDDYDTNCDVDWNITFTVWRALGNDEERDNLPLTFKAKALDAAGNVKVLGNRTLGIEEMLIDEWVKPEDTLEDVFMPSIIESSSALTGSVAKIANGAFGQITLDNNIRSKKKAFMSSLPTSGGIDITEENMERCLAAYTAKLCADKVETNTEHIYKPIDEESKEYKEWVADSIIMAMFDFTNATWAYRGIEVDGYEYNRGNFMFPLRKQFIIDNFMSGENAIITDKKIIKDINENDGFNELLVGMIDKYKEYMSVTARQLLEFGIDCIIESYKGKIRRQCMFQNYTNAWDASITQIRSVKNLWSMEKEKKLVELTSILKDSMSKKMKSIGFIKDVEYFD